MGRRVEDTTIAVGEYTFGSGGYSEHPVEYKGGPAVLQRVLPEVTPGGASVRLIDQFRVVLGVEHGWQAQAIAAILNGR